jgi:lipid-A-disaccharide synthase
VRSKLDREESLSEVRAILPGGEKRERMFKDFDELRRMMGKEGASDRFAQDIVKSLRG